MIGIEKESERNNFVTHLAMENDDGKAEKIGVFKWYKMLNTN